MVHFLNEDGMVACNPRDREAAHRAEDEGIGSYNARAVTCPKCWQVMGQGRLRRPDKRNGKKGKVERDEAADW